MRAKKSKASVRATGAVRAKVIKKSSSVKGKLAARSITEVKVHRRATAGVATVKTRTSLRGMKIYPASVEPSARAKRIVAALAGRSFAA